MLYIMRHGKTDWNIQHKLQGRTDIPLNEEGRQMAKQAREDYLNIPIDICYCSPLIRARETAELVLQGRNIPILYDDRLIEMGFGIYEGTAHGAMNSSILCQVKHIPLQDFWKAGIPNCKLMKLC